MPIQCKIIDLEKVHEEGKSPQAGDMWYAPWYLRSDGTARNMLSKQYEIQWLGKRPPLVVCLPNGTDILLDMAYTNGDNPNREGWTITGEAPNITVSPSINYIGHYHGWLQNGVLSDDVEGRKY